MSFFSSLFETKVVNADALTFEGLGISSSKTGLSIDEVSALRASAVYACGTLITNGVGMVPLRLVREREDGSKEVAKNHPLHRVLSLRPNEWQTSMEWRQTQLLHALFNQGGYSFINRAEGGEVLELIPLMPDRVTPKQDRQWKMTYEVSDSAGRVVTLQRSQVHVIHGLSWNGYSALEVISQGREAIALALAEEETQARLHSQGARPGGVLTTTAVLTKDQIDRIKGQFADAYSGVANAFKTMLLDNGLKFEPWTSSGVDGQHLENRKFQTEEIARFFNVFPSMIGYSDKASTYASAEAFFTAHVQHTLQPWVTLWEQAIARDLLTPTEVQQGYSARFFLQALMRGDSKTRAEFYKSAINDGWMTRNEVRRLEDLNPIDGLDKVLTPLNMGQGQPADDDDPAP